MKVVIENIIAVCKIKGSPDLEEIAGSIEDARYQPEIFKGITLDREEPPYRSFILEDGTIKFHGLTSEDGMRSALDDILSIPILEKCSIEEPLRIQEIVASVDLGGPVDAKMVYDEFQKEGVIYDPSELPGFILNVGSTGIEVLIFPEGKIISKGATDLLDAVSSLQMVYGRINEK